MATKKNLKPEANVKKTAAPVSGRDSKKAGAALKKAAEPAVKSPLKAKAPAEKAAPKAKDAKKPAASAPKAVKKPSTTKPPENQAKKTTPERSAPKTAAKKPAFEDKKRKMTLVAVQSSTAAIKKDSPAAPRKGPAKKEAAAANTVAKNTAVKENANNKKNEKARFTKEPARNENTKKPAADEKKNEPKKTAGAEIVKRTGAVRDDAAVRKADDTAARGARAAGKPENARKTVAMKNGPVINKTDIEAKERIGVKKNLTTKKNSSGPAVKAEAIAKPAATAAKKSAAAAAAAKAAKKPAAKAPEKASSKPAAREVKKVVVKTPQAKPEAMNVTSADVENLYGKHYIINTAQELPDTYGKNRLITLVRDPEWIYTFWDVATETIAGVRKSMGAQEFSVAKRVIRVYEGDGGANYSDIELTDTASSWYIHVKPDAAYVLELGYRSRSGEFYKVAASNDVAMPPAGVSAEGDEKWMVKDGVFEKIYELSGGSQLGMSSADIMQAMARGMKPEEFSQLITRGVSSETLSSQFAAEKAREEENVKKQRKFWMVLNTELIVYGATEPDASVTLMGRPVKLRPDGTFSVRMALPDTDIDIPAVGVSADKVDEITITPEVHKRTHYSRKEKELAL